MVRAIAEAIASECAEGESPSNNVIILVKYIYYGNLITLERIPIDTNFTTTRIFERGGFYTTKPAVLLALYDSVRILVLRTLKIIVKQLKIFLNFVVLLLQAL